MIPQWKGIYPAVTTKFNKEGRLDPELFARNLEAQLAAGVNGLVVAGTLGEASVLAPDEKQRLTEIALQTAAGRVPVIVNIAEGATRDAVQQARQARDAGANGLMVLPAMRYKTDHRETVTWFKTLADATDLPVMVYNNPVDYKTEITPAMFEELAACENIVAVKDSTRDITNITRMRIRFGDRFRLLCGVDTIALEAFCAGADGWVAGLVCAFPEETVRLYQLVKAGRLEEARALYQWFMPLLEMDIYPKLVQYIKLAEQETGLGSEWVRPPRLCLEGEERERILTTIRQAIMKRPGPSR